MQEKNKVSQDQLSSMIGLVAQKLGKSPEQLTEELKMGNYPDPRVKSILGNKAELQALLESPKIQELLHTLQEKK